MLIGYIYALIVSFLFSLYFVPRKISTLSPAAYTMFVGFGFFVPSILYCLTLNDFSILTTPILLLCALVGVLWMVAFVFFTISIDKLGLSRSNQWKNLQGPIGAILSLLILSEYQSANIFLVLAAITAIFISAVLFSVKKDSEKRIDTKGIYFAVIAGFLFGLNSVIQKYVTMNFAQIPPQQLYFSAGVFLSALLYLYLKDKKLSAFKTTFSKNGILALTAGALYFSANYFQIKSNQIIPNSVSFTLIQFNAVWTVLIGILIFKEIDLKKHWKRVGLGLIFAVLSIIILFFGMN